MPNVKGCHVVSCGTRFTISGLLLFLLLSALWTGCSERQAGDIPAAHFDEPPLHAVLTLLFDGVPPLDNKMVEAHAVNTDPNVPAIRKRPDVVWYVHEAAKDCTQCHGNRQGRRFSSEVQLTARPPELCYECHKDVVPAASRGWVHGPAAAGECLLCHEPHKTTNPHLLRAPTSSLCHKCHQEVADESAPDDTKESHSQCTSCHAAHASPKVGGTDRTPELCYKCHESLEPAALKGWVHGPVAVGQCLLCHEPHRTRNPHQLRQRIPALCYGCHQEAAVNSVRDHAEESYADCSNCHESHTSLERPLLKPGAQRQAGETEAPESVYGSSGR